MINCIIWTSGNVSLIVSIVVALVTIPKTLSDWLKNIRSHNKKIIKEYLEIRPHELTKGCSTHETDPYNMGKLITLLYNIKYMNSESGFDGWSTKEEWNSVQNIANKLLNSKYLNPMGFDGFEKFIDGSDKWNSTFYSEFEPDIKSFVDRYSKFNLYVLSKSS